MFAMPAQAAKFLYWNSPVNDWVDVANNWTCTWDDALVPPCPCGGSAVPGDGDLAIIKEPGVVQIDATHLFAGAPSEIYVGDGSGITMIDPCEDSAWPYSPNVPGAGHVRQTGGTVNYLDWLTVGRLNAPGTRLAGDESKYELQGGSIVETGSGGYLLIGDSNAAGTMTVTGTELTPASISVLNNSTFVGLGAGSDGLLSMSGPYSTATLRSLLVGYSGSAADSKAIGAVNLSDGAKITVNEWCNAGVWNYSEGSIALSGSSELNIGGGLVLGDNWGGSHANPAPGKGTLTLSGSAKVTVASEFHLGSLTYAEGTLTMSGSSELTTGAYTSCGRSAGKAVVTLNDSAVFRPLYGHIGGTGNFPDPPDLPFGDTVDITMNGKSRIEATYWLNVGEAYCTTTLTMNNTRDPLLDPPSITAQSMDFGWGDNSNSTATMNGTSSISLTGNLNLGLNGANAHGSLTMNNSSSVSANFLVVGSNGAGNLGTLTMNDSARFETVSGIAIADAIGADGTVTMTGDSSLTTAGWLAVGNSYNGGGTGQVFLSGNAYMATTGNELEIAWGGTGILHIGHENPADNAVVYSSLPVVLGWGTASGDTNARIDINRGGTLEAPGIITGGTPPPLSSVLNFNGGTLRATANNADFMTNGGASVVFEANVQEHGATIDTDGFNIGLTVGLTEDPLSTDGGLTKVRDGILTLAGVCDYTGDTMVEAGGLSVTGSITSDVSVADEAVLMGTGTVYGDVTVAGGGGSGGSIAPGLSIGTLTVTGNVDLEGTLDVEYYSITQGHCDLLAVGGQLDLAGGTISFTDLYSPTVPRGPYIFATYGSLTEDRPTEEGVPMDWHVDYNYLGGNQIALIPEPGMLVLLMGLALAMAAGWPVRR